jgi:TPR repeat protein/predicted Ser/Thr protein kinase
MDTPINAQALPAGTRLEEFVIESILGSGGFGVTYLARDTSLGRQVVIKENLPAQFFFRDTQSQTVMPRHTTGEDAENFRWSLENFSKEAAMLASLDHPGIVKVLRSFQGFGTAYFVMPFVEGMTLDELMRLRQRDGQSFTEEELRGLLDRMLSALGYLHERGIYHRDIKPGNILITNEGRPVLIDFGSARQRLSERSMTVVESAGYTPFEQLQSRGNVGPWSDLYALGGTLVKALTGEAPPKAMDRMRKDPYQPLAERVELRSQFTWEFLHGIDKALAVDEENRWQSAVEWLATVVATPVAVTPAPVPKIPNPKVIETPAPEYSQVPEVTRAPRDHGVLITVVMLALALVGGAGWWFGIEEPKRAETARVARAKADTEQRQREEDEDARIAEEARMKKEAYDAAEKDRARLAKEKADADEKQRQMAAQAEATRLAAENKPAEQNLDQLVNYYVDIGFSPIEAKQFIDRMGDKMKYDAPKAMRLLAALYEGREMFDVKECMYWHHKAAEAGSADAMWRLHTILHPGFAFAYKGYPKGDAKTSFEWARKAAEHGNAKGMNAMGSYCWYGVRDNEGPGMVREPNKKEAVLWWKRAADAGSDAAKKSLKDHHEEILTLGSISEDQMPFTQKSAGRTKDLVGPHSIDKALPLLKTFQKGTIDEARESIRLLDEQLKKYPGNARIEKVKATITGIFREEASLTSALNNRLAAENKLTVQTRNLEIASQPSGLTGQVNQDSVRRGQRLVAETQTAIRSADSTADDSRAKLRELLNSALDELPAPEGPALEPVWRKVAGRNNIPISK